MQCFQNYFISSSGHSGVIDYLGIVERYPGHNMEKKDERDTHGIVESLAKAWLR
jgi:hypothetical protein